MKLATITIMLLCVCQVAGAVSIAPEIVEQLKQSGQLQTIFEADQQARERGVWKANPDPVRFGVATDVDTLHCLIVLADFSDMQHEWGFHSTPEDFDTLLFSIDFRQPGSMTDYYDETSYGQAYLVGQVTSWYRMPETYAYYVDGQRGFGTYPHNAQRLTEDAVTAADPDVDFSIYDNNQDGWVDALFVVHAGPGYEDTGNLNYVHSHAWVISQPMPFDGVQVYGYSMEPEETGSGGFATIGVYCHEFGHVLGLPDLYDYGYDSDGVGSWSVMAGGSWGGGGARPVHFDAWSKVQLGWVTPTEPANNLDNEQIDAVEYNPDIYRLYSLGLPETEYFLVENRRRELFDMSLPGDGLVIFHIDDQVPNNDDQTHYKVAVEQADGRFDLENNRGSDSGDPWPGLTNHRSFDDFSNPNSRFYSGAPSEVGVSDISDSDSVMFADLSVVYVDPLYQLLSLAFDDMGGNGNGIPEAGEMCNIDFTAQNTRAFVNDLTVTASCTDPTIQFIDSTAVFANVPVNEPFSNDSDPISFSVPSNYQSRFVIFNLRFVSRNGLYVQDITHRAVVGTPSLLLVDDDNGMSVDTFYTQTLDSVGQTFIRWDVSTQGSPAAELNQYDNVIWFTGHTRVDLPLTADVNAIIGFLNSGGRIMISSQDFIQRLSERSSPSDTTLLRQYLKVEYDRLEIDHHPSGQPGTIFDNLDFLTSGSGGANNQVSQDAFTVYSGGIWMIIYNGGRPAAVAVSNTYAALTLGFGFEGINDLFPNYYDSRREFMQAALSFLIQPVGIADGMEPLPGKISLAQNYPNPFNPSTTISFALSSPSEVKLEIFDLLGRFIDVPAQGFFHAGSYSVTWNAARRSSGIYYYRLTSDGESRTQRMTLLK
jgi:immune inhibitor A